MSTHLVIVLLELTLQFYFLAQELSFTYLLTILCYHSDLGVPCITYRIRRDIVFLTDTVRIRRSDSGEA